jgi:hypothetical protein
MVLWFICATPDCANDVSTQGHICIPCGFQKKEDEIIALRDQLEKVTAALEAIIATEIEDSCDIDSRGYCDAHASRSPCVIARAKAAIEATQGER